MSSIRRINNEINKINNLYENNRMKNYSLNIIKPYPLLNLKIYPNAITNNYYNIVNFNNYELLIDLKINKIIFKIKICISNTYPFLPPEIKINNKPYHYLLQSNHMKKINCIHCLCCSSIICPGNWKPSHGIIHIINEIYQNIYKKKCILEVLHLEKLEIKYLKFNSNIKDYLLC